MEDEIVLAGKKYVSSKRAAEITGYAKDYIGQLCRGGKLQAKLIGRNWYILADSLDKTGKKAYTDAQKFQKNDNISAKKVSYLNTTSLIDELQAEFYTDDSPLIPQIIKKTDESTHKVQVHEVSMHSSPLKEDERPTQNISIKKDPTPAIQQKSKEVPERVYFEPKASMRFSLVSALLIAFTLIGFIYPFTGVTISYGDQKNNAYFVDTQLASTIISVIKN